ncbi:MbtH family protein [Parachitinimonas caeni]|uniref:MbtH family NRPS accessory protein n=1 Tax=Parachitinimonas caeni TaxID=3031301 RepID=A0ABT7E126_9NEIS|nr:MbtH family NRPS accessory protein [Parachitinimonas caeni]MDK2126021.1 MbtH family NRPS accessory protein [Parachitinimonas caeni]
MTNQNNLTEPIFNVVINHEAQYSLWQADRTPPAGWSTTGMQGSRADCLAYIATHWTDMRPLSLRSQAPVS